MIRDHNIPMPRTPGIPGTRRYIFNMLTVVSLVLLLATVGAIQAY